MMRRKDREVSERAALEAILKKCQVGRLAMVEDGKPYVVPLNYGYEWEGEYPVLYFHGAMQGRKIDILSKNPLVCFEADCEHELVEGETACGYSYRFASVIGDGIAEIVTEEAEKRKGLTCLMRHFTGREDWTFDSPYFPKTAVIRVTLTGLTGKRKE